MYDILRRTWAEIDLDIIRENYKKIRRAIDKKSKIMCVIKADAYGHGAKFLAKEYEDLGADWFAASNIEEALQVRFSGVTKPILILGHTPVKMARKLVAFNISQAVFSEKYAQELSDFATSCGIKVKIHIKLDTGMNRIGFTFQNIKRDIKNLDIIEECCRLPGLVTEGMFTHFSSADEVENGIIYTMEQFESFSFAKMELQKRGINIPLCHCSNSGAILSYPELNFNMVRAGIILYGLYPSENVMKSLKIEPAMQLKTVIAQIKQIESGSALSYGRTFVAKEKMKVATVPIGYADGYFRSFSNKAKMLVNGKYANVLGKVCMDQLMLDVTNIPQAKEDSVVTVFGKDGKNQIFVEDLAQIADTINYEIISAVSKRVTRLYKKGGKVIATLNYICS